MKQYLELLREVMEDGVLQQNRTGIPTKFIPSGMLKFDLQKGFPILTSRKVPFIAPIAEMRGFLEAYTNAADFRALGCNFWNDNANKESADPVNRPNAWLRSPYRKGEDDIGEVYGYFWRHWVGDDGTVHDQVLDALNTLNTNPEDRRMIVSGWKVEAIKQKRGALPPCHVSWHIIADTTNRELHLNMWQRSCDTVLGIGGGNITEYAFLLMWIARLAGYKPRWLTMHLDDVHIYQNHFEGVALQLEREPRELPKMVFADHLHEFHRDGFDANKITAFMPRDMQLVGYNPHDPIKFEMAV